MKFWNIRMPEAIKQDKSGDGALPPAVKLDNVSVVFNNFTAVKKADL